MQLRAHRTFTVEPWLPARIEGLRLLALNLHWTWSTDTAALFARLSPDRWEETGHNPVRLLQVLPREDLERAAADDAFVDHFERAIGRLAAYVERPPQAPMPAIPDGAVIAYFSLEFALTESFGSYSGGLGVLAGDHLKSASDLGLPLVGVGLFYRHGYFQQIFTPDGWQTEEYHDIEPAHHALTLVRDSSGQPLRVHVPIENRDVAAAVWRLDVGQIRLFLLDSDVPENSEADRAIGSRLYGGDVETRIQQEILLGVGGVRALRAMGLPAAVCHMNEGHSSLLGIERIREIMEEHGANFEEARLPVAAATVFTTHTAVAAGIDLFPPDLVRRYLGSYYTKLGIDDRAFLGLGRVHADDDHEPFSMALLGLHLSGHRNGVSRVHGAVSRKLWQATWPAVPADLAPIGHVTNGVHLPTWVGHEMGTLYDRYVGDHWRDAPGSVPWERISDVPAWELWGVHTRQREVLVRRARDRYHDMAARHGLVISPRGNDPLDPGILTIGFARRFAAYKRATLLFADLDRLAAIVNHPARPVQFVFAGKAHPRDEPAKALIREVVTHSRRPELRDRLIVLEGYDVEMARSLVQGCDVWLNTPLRPLEASGTSGMKAVANGALHMSVLDGWWSEGYQPGLGWAIGRDRPEDDPAVQDAFDAESLYSLLENEIAPMFYDRDHDGVPTEWVRWMQASIAAHTPVFSTQRMVGDYASSSYAPAAAAGALLRGDGLRAARDLAGWLAGLRDRWAELKVLAVEDDASDTAAPGTPVTVTVQGHWGGVDPASLDVSILCGPAATDGALEAAGTSPMSLVEVGEDGACLYRGSFPPPGGGRVGYAVRITPSHPALHDPIDTGLVLWA